MRKMKKILGVQTDIKKGYVCHYSEESYVFLLYIGICTGDEEKKRKKEKSEKLQKILAYINGEMYNYSKIHRNMQEEKERIHRISCREKYSGV